MPTKAMLEAYYRAHPHISPEAEMSVNTEPTRYCLQRTPARTKQVEQQNSSDAWGRYGSAIFEPYGASMVRVRLMDGHNAYRTHDVVREQARKLWADVVAHLGGPMGRDGVRVSQWVDGAWEATRTP